MGFEDPPVATPRSGPFRHAWGHLWGPPFSMLSQAHTGALRGIEAIPVVAEVNIASGLPTFTIVGLPQGAVREGRERVVAAVRNSRLHLRSIAEECSP